METPLEQNCAEASGFDTNLRIPSHDASDAPKKASVTYLNSRLLLVLLHVLIKSNILCRTQIVFLYCKLF